MTESATATRDVLPAAHDRSGLDPLEVALVASTPAFVCVIGVGGHILLFNRALERATGWASEEVVGRLFWDVLVVAHEVEPAKDCIHRALTLGEGAPPQEGDWLDRFGGSRRVSMLMSVLVDDSGHRYAMVCVGFDVTHQRQVEAQLRERTRTDVLTGLANREALFDALGAELLGPEAAGCGVLFCDLDGFKIANDTHGHEVGDLLLREAGRRLLEVTTTDDVVARYGGDEFVVLCRRADAHRVATVRARVEEAFSTPFTTPQGLVTVGISVGTAVGRPGDGADGVIAAADRHMYGVKTSRRAAR